MADDRLSFLKTAHSKIFGFLGICIIVAVVLRMEQGRPEVTVSLSSPAKLNPINETDSSTPRPMCSLIASPFSTSADNACDRSESSDGSRRAPHGSAKLMNLLRMRADSLIPQIKAGSAADAYSFLELVHQCERMLIPVNDGQSICSEIVSFKSDAEHLVAANRYNPNPLLARAQVAQVLWDVENNGHDVQDAGQIAAKLSEALAASNRIELPSAQEQLLAQAIRDDLSRRAQLMR